LRYPVHEMAEIANPQLGDAKEQFGHALTGGHRHRLTAMSCRIATKRSGFVVRRRQARASNPRHHGVEAKWFERWSF
jgi:hypothetical protein